MLVFTVWLGAASTLAATRARGVVFPGLMLDPFGSFSALHLPSWSREVAPLRFPDRLVAVNGAPLSHVAAEKYHSREIQRTFEALRSSGVRSVALSFARGRQVIEVRRDLRVVGTSEISWFWGLYLVVGLLVVWSGMVALVSSTHRPAARAYALWALSVFVFLATFFDYHTTRALVPWFSLATVGVGSGFIALALTFPMPPPGARLRAASVALLSLSLLLAAGLLGAPALGVDGTALRIAASFYAPLAALTLLIATGVRYWRGAPAGRVQLRPVLIGMLGVPLFVCFGSITAVMTGVTWVHTLLPMVVPLVPLSIGFALVRHNILGATEVLTRRLLVVPTVAVATLLAMLSWLGLRSVMSGTAMDLTLPTFLSGGFFVALVVLGHRALGRWLFPASAHFRPTVQQIADRLATLEHHDSLPETLADAIRLWLPTDSVRLLTPDAASRVEHLPDDALVHLRRGAHVWTNEDPWRRHLLLPMRSLGELRGVLVLAPKHHGALYTSEDLALLETIASLGAVALHNAAILEELESLRRIEVEVVREDKRATLGLLGAELAHEISHPLQLFRGMLRRAGRGPLSETDLEVGGDEIERLERLLGNMRRLEAPAPRQEPVRVREPVERAQRLLAELSIERQVTVTCEVPASVTVLGDADALVQIFSNLLRNAVQAAPRGGHAGIRVRPSPQVVIDVWDDGPGVPEHLVPTLFHRWVTNKEGGTGLGLAVARNLVVNLRWEINYLREGDRTVFRLHARTDDRSTPPPRMLSLQPDPVDPS
jgi:signal transduction histidine kinase